MTDARTRNEIMANVSYLWSGRPELRFTQLIQLIAGEGDPFYMEDKEFLRRAARLADGDMKNVIKEVRRYE